MQVWMNGHRQQINIESVLSIDIQTWRIPTRDMKIERRFVSNRGKLTKYLCDLRLDQPISLEFGTVVYGANGGFLDVAFLNNGRKITKRITIEGSRLLMDRENRFGVTYITASDVRELFAWP